MSQLNSFRLLYDSTHQLGDGGTTYDPPNAPNAVLRAETMYAEDILDRLIEWKLVGTV